MSNMRRHINGVIADNSISYAAKGLLMQLLSIRDGETIFPAKLRHYAADTVENITAVMAELVGHGYIVQTPVYDVNGKIHHWMYDVHYIRVPPGEHQSPSVIGETEREEKSTKRVEKAAICIDTTGKSISLDNNTNTNTNVTIGIQKGRPSSVDEVAEYCREKGYRMDPAEFWDHFESNGWRVGGRSPMKDWRAAANNWERKIGQYGGGKPVPENSGQDPRPARGDIRGAGARAGIFIRYSNESDDEFAERCRAGQSAL